MAHAEIILTENIPNLGAEADVVKVRRGYARNFLLPTGKAIESTSASVRQINHLKAKRAEREALEVQAAEALAAKIGSLELSFELETGYSGKAFGSVSHKDVTDKLLLALQGMELPKHAVVMERAIKEGGTHNVQVKLHHHVVATVKVTVKVPAKAAQAEDARSAGRKRKQEAEATDAPTEVDEIV